MGSGLDWGRMPRPQADGYDMMKTVALAHERFGFVKQIYSAPVPTMFDGRVLLAHYKPDQKPAPYLDPMPFDSPIIKQTDDALRQIWPEAYRGMQMLCNEIRIMRDVNYPDGAMTGCTCGNLSEFGGICTTAQGVIGFMHGCVHEMIGHWKLKALGVDLMTWDGPLVANNPEDRYVSPVRKDITRPMGAVLHAQYSYLHVLEMEIRAKKAGLDPDMLPLNVARMAEGRETLRAWGPGEEGESFAKAMDEWTAELLDEGRSLIKA